MSETMYSYGRKSISKLDTVYPLLRNVAVRALEMSPYDITIIHGWRGEDIQNALYDSGASQKQWPYSKHNNTLNSEPLSLAIDFGPWVNGRVPWDDTHIFAIIAGCFFAAAKELEVTIRYGGDWDTDGSTKDQTLMDWGHIECVI